MKIYFYNLGFYCDMINNVIPTNSVEITQSQWSEFCGTPPAGKVLSQDDKGQPCWADISNDDKIAIINDEIARKKKDCLRVISENKTTGDMLAAQAAASDEKSGKLLQQESQSYIRVAAEWTNYLVALSQVKTDDPNAVIPELPAL